MEFDSDTESEPGSPSPLLTPMLCDGPTLTSSALSIVDLHKVEREIQKLSGPDILSGLSYNNKSRLDEFQQSANALIAFVTQLPELLVEDKASDVLINFGNLVCNAMLNRLFFHRQNIRKTAAASKTMPKSATVVTCIDELLVKIHDSLQNIHCRDPPPGKANELVPTMDSIQSQKRTDILLAAVQLPEKWYDVHIVVGSTNFSPAAKRLAMSLLFAAYVVSPQVNNIHSWPEVGPTAGDISMSLDLAIEKLSSDLLFRIDPFPRRVMAAMTLVLCSVVNRKLPRSKDDFSPPELRPEGSRHLLDLIKSVMGRENGSYMPVEQLDVPQALLIHWGNSLPWIWSTWDDPRVANTEYLPVVAKTATWLYYLNETVYELDVASAIFFDIRASSRAMSQLLLSVLQDLIDAQRMIQFDYSVLLQLIRKLFGIVIQYLEWYTLEVDLTIQSQIPEFSTSILTAYTLLGTSGGDIHVKDLAIECLTLVPPGVLTNSIQNLLEAQTQFIIRLENVIRNCIRAITDYQSEDDDVLVLTATKTLVELMTLLLSSVDPRDKIVIFKLATPFVSILFKFVKSHESTSMPFQVLRNPLLMILSSYRSTVLTQPFEEDIWTLVLPSGPHSIVNAALFSEYIMTIGRLCNSLFTCEAWSFLLSVLVAIIGREVLEDEEPLALLSITGICCGVHELIHVSRPFDRVRMLSSPWTSTLRMLLQKLLHEEAEDPYSQKLVERVYLIGEKVLKLISIEGQKDDIALDTSSIAHISRMIYYRDSSFAGVLYMCSDSTWSPDSNHAPLSAPDPTPPLPLPMISHKPGLPLTSNGADADFGRRGKRRCDNFPSLDAERCSVFSTCENRLRENQVSSFATTSAQFNLFSRPSNSGGKGRWNPSSDFKVSHERQLGCLPDLARLRSSAFWELRQSISENGEGLVRRMRDYENSRTRHPTPHKAKEAGKRERKKLHFPKKKILLDISDVSDEEDVLISSGESTNHILRGTFLFNVKDPIDVMEVDSDWSSAPHTKPTRSRGLCASQDTQYAANSIAIDKEPSTPITSSEPEEIIQQSPVISLQSTTPSLFNSTGESPCSPYISLPSSSSVSNEDFFYPSLLGRPSTSEKVIAALNLAMANGAGSINDYSLVNNLEEIILVENYNHGDLWN